MKASIDQLPLELCETIISAVREVPKNAQLYWARNKEVLVEVLNKLKDFEPVTFSEADPYFLPAVKATMRKVLWRKRLVDRQNADEFVRCVLKHQPPQPACSIRSCHINTGLHSHEFFEELGIESANDFASSAFSYSQIVSVLSRHRDEKKRGGTLFYKGANYFPLMLPTGEVEFMSFHSRRPWNEHAGWKGWFLGKNPYFNKGQLLLRAMA